MKIPFHTMFSEQRPVGAESKISDRFTARMMKRNLKSREVGLGGLGGIKVKEYRKQSEVYNENREEKDVYYS